MTTSDILMDGPFMTSRQLTDYSDEPGYAIPPATEAPATLTRAEAAYAHLASFQRGDEVDVGGPRFFQPGVVTTAQQDYCDRMERAFLVVEGCGVRTRVSVASLLSGKHTIDSLADAKAGNVRYFDAASWAMRNPEN